MIRRLISLFWGDGGGIEDAPPRWKLTPLDDGTYMLERFNDSVGIYLAERARVTEAQAKEAIKSYERPELYFDGIEGGGK